VRGVGLRDNRVDLTLERPGDHLYVSAVEAAGIRVGERLHTRAIIVSPQQLIEDWPVVTAADLDAARLDVVLTLDPEIVLLGTGPQQVFPDPRLLMPFYSRGVGIEVMSTAAACRTFNVLVSEGRLVVAALLPLNP